MRAFVAMSLLVQCVTASPIMDLEEDLPLYDEIFSEQDGVDLNSLLETMKDDFLKTLNLSGIPVQAPVKVEPPEYMLELYNKFAMDRTTMPSANIVRSFKNEGKMLGVRSLSDYIFLSIQIHQNQMDGKPLLGAGQLCWHTICIGRLYFKGWDSEQYFNSTRLRRQTVHFIH